MSEQARIHVVAGLITDMAGNYLIARRPAGKHLAGFWEFPGGKLEIGETPLAALKRELAEELAIRVIHAEPFIQITHDYPDKKILLDVWLIQQYEGQPKGSEGQQICFVTNDRLNEFNFPPANQAIVALLKT